MIGLKRHTALSASDLTLTRDNAKLGKFQIPETQAMRMATRAVMSNIIRNGPIADIQTSTFGRGGRIGEYGSASSLRCKQISLRRQSNTDIQVCVTFSQSRMLWSRPVNSDWVIPVLLKILSPAEWSMSPRTTVHCQSSMTARSLAQGLAHSQTSMSRCSM